MVSKPFNSQNLNRHGLEVRVVWSGEGRNTSWKYHILDWDDDKDGMVCGSSSGMDERACRPVSIANFILEQPYNACRKCQAIIAKRNGGERFHFILAQ